MNERRALRDALLFGGITIALSYLVFWGPIAVFGIPTISFVSSIRGPTWAIALFMAGGFVPSAVALILTGILEGRAGLKRLLARAVRFRLGVRWYAAILGVVLLGTAGQVLINRLLGRSFDYSIFALQLPSFVPLIVIGPISEEFGWRGYLLPKLQSSWNALLSAVAVGAVWALWHLPLFFIVGTSQHELSLPFAGFFAALLCESIIMAWLNNNTAGSIWTAILFHWLYTYAAQVVSTGAARSVLYNWIEFTPYLVIAVVVIAVWGPRRLSRT